jgi:hypothetical protein
MPQNENKKFTGFVVHYANGNTVEEKNDYISQIAGCKKSTNWHEIDKDKITALELFWNGESKIKIDKSSYPHIGPSDWYFSHYGSLDMSTHKNIVISRNIGYIKDKLLTIYCVDEKSGVVKIEHRNKP